MTVRTGLLFAAAAVAMISAVVPPFQSPDEPHHFAAALIYAKGEERRLEVEADVLRMMDRANWWRLVGIGRPVPLPKSLSDIEFLMDKEESGDFRTRIARFVAFHRTVGFVLRPAAGASAEMLYLVCRAVIAVLFLASLAIIWMTLTLLAGAFGPFVKTGLFFILFLPQFMLSSVSVGPDVLVLFLSAVFFYGAASLILGKRGAFSGVLVLGAAGIGALSDRSAFFMALAAVVLPLFVIRRANARQAVPATLLFAMAGILAAYGTVLLFPLQVERIYLSVKGILDSAGPALGSMFDLGGFARNFWVFTADSFLLRFGWLVFPPPKIVYWIWRLGLAAIAAGLVAGAVGWAKRRMRGENEDGGAPARLRWTLFAGTTLFLQAFGAWAFYGSAGIFGQGRYFFPLIVPALFFMAAGLQELGRLIARKGAASGRTRIVFASAAMALFLLFSFSIWTLVVPAFHMILRGPHPGI